MIRFTVIMIPTAAAIHTFDVFLAKRSKPLDTTSAARLGKLSGRVSRPVTAAARGRIPRAVRMTEAMTDDTASD